MSMAISLLSSITRRRLAVAALLAVAVLLGTGNAHAAPTTAQCTPGLFCAWADADYRGVVHQVAPTNPPKERCVPLPAGLEASSFVNHTGHPVTVYQDGLCSTEADFATYPSGSFVPKASYTARAVKVWRH